MKRHEADLRFRRDSIFDASGGRNSIPLLIERLGLVEPTPVMVIIGGANRMSRETGEKVRTFFEQSLAPVLEASGMVVVTGGTDSGVMAIAGQTLSSVATLVGVSPRGALVSNPSVDLQKDHHVNVLTPGTTWGSETDYMVSLASALTQGARCGLVLIVNGGDVAFEETKYFVEAGWPILAVAGSGGVADALVKSRRLLNRVQHKNRLLKNADLDRVALDGSPREVRKRIHWYVSEDELLKSAWTYYAAFDRRAGKQQRFNRVIKVILQVVSLAILSLVLIRFEITEPIPTNLPWLKTNSFLQTLKNVTVPIAVALPIALAAAAAIGQSVAADRGWRIVRASAESLKREIYRYRAWLTVDVENRVSSGEGRQYLKRTVSSALRRSTSSGFLLSVDLTSRRGRPRGLDEGDDELAPLSIASYTSHRIDGQISYFQTKGRGLRRKAIAVVLAGVLIAAISGTVAGTYFAPWAAVAVLGVTALTAYLERSRLTERAARFATASADLAEIKSGLHVQSVVDLRLPKSLLSTVERAEAALEGESHAWEQLVWKDVRESRRNAEAMDDEGYPSE